MGEDRDVVVVQPSQMRIGIFARPGSYYIYVYKLCLIKGRGRVLMANPLKIYSTLISSAKTT